MAEKNNLNILFVSRAYPPVVGGIENQNYELSQWLPQITQATTIANTHGKKFLPFFLLRLFITLPFTIQKYDVTLLGDGVLGIVSWWLKLFNKNTKVACVTHGLDLTYKNSFYQKWWVKKFIPTCDKLIAVGNQTITEGIKHGLDKDKFVFIPNGVHPEKFIHKDIPKNAIFDIIDKKHQDKKILLTFGRLARRKGVAWFIHNVLPQLPDNVIYIVAGSGLDKENIQNAIKETNTQDRVITIGYVEDADRTKIFAGTDVFIQPNITVAGDMEGFGISVIEAGVTGLPVLASELEGLKDAITDNVNGIFVESENASDWQEKITMVLSDEFDRKAFGKNAQNYIIENLSWKIIIKEYFDVLKSL